eukprot:SM000070S21299  [mRNA]  locus=s70:105350:108801:- [translate_table: standard]
MPLTAPRVPLPLAAQTRTVKKGGTRPIFDHSLQIGVPEGEQTLLCEVFMTQVKGRDQLLGWAKIPVRDHAQAAKPKPRAKTEHRLMNGLSSDAAAGVLTLTLTYHDRCGGGGAGRQPRASVGAAMDGLVAPPGGSEAPVPPEGYDVAATLRAAMAATRPATADCKGGGGIPAPWKAPGDGGRRLAVAATTGKLFGQELTRPVAAATGAGGCRQDEQRYVRASDSSTSACTDDESHNGQRRDHGASSALDREDNVMPFVGTPYAGKCQLMQLLPLDGGSSGAAAANDCAAGAFAAAAGFAGAEGGPRVSSIAAAVCEPGERGGGNGPSAFKPYPCGGPPKRCRIAAADHEAALDMGLANGGRERRSPGKHAADGAQRSGGGRGHAAVDGTPAASMARHNVEVAPPTAAADSWLRMTPRAAIGGADEVATAPPARVPWLSASAGTKAAAVAAAANPWSMCSPAVPSGGGGNHHHYFDGGGGGSPEFAYSLLPPAMAASGKVVTAMTGLRQQPGAVACAMADRDWLSVARPPAELGKGWLAVAAAGHAVDGSGFGNRDCGRNVGSVGVPLPPPSLLPPPPRPALAALHGLPSNGGNIGSCGAAEAAAAGLPRAAKLLPPAVNELPMGWCSGGEPPPPVPPPPLPLFGEQTGLEATRPRGCERDLHVEGQGLDAALLSSVGEAMPGSLQQQAALIWQASQAMARSQAGAPDAAGRYLAAASTWQTCMAASPERAELVLAASQTVLLAPDQLASYYALYRSSVQQFMQSVAVLQAELTGTSEDEQRERWRQCWVEHCQRLDVGRRQVAAMQPSSGVVQYGAGAFF